MSAYSIIWSLGIDKTGVTSTLQQAGKEVETSGSKMENALNRASGAHGRLLASSHRVAHQIGNVSKEMLSGADASQVFGSALEGLGRSLNIGLGGIAALAVGAIGVEQIHKYQEQVKKLNEEVNKLLTPRSGSVDVTALSALEDHLKRVAEALHKVEEAQKGSFFQQFMDKFTAASAAIGANKFINPFASREKQLRGLRGAESDDMSAIASKKERELDIKYSKQPNEAVRKAMELKQEFGEKIAETGTPGSSKENQLLSLQLRRELELSLTALAESVTRKLEDKTGQSLSDVATKTKDFSQGGTIQEDFVKRTAQQVIEEERLAKESFLGLRPDEGRAHLSRAEQLKDQIPNLNPSEKLSADLRMALDSADVLQKIKENTADFSVKRQ